MFSRRPHRLPAAAVLVVIAGSGLLVAGGCSHDVGGWRMHYDSLTDARFDRVTKEEVQIVSGDFDTLTMNPQIDGVACIGTTRFKTYGQLASFESDPDRTIRPHAAEKGAQLVRWGMREVAPAEKNTPAQWEYVAVYYRGFWRPEVASAGN
jgi:hypothetical protein